MVLFQSTLLVAVGGSAAAAFLIYRHEQCPLKVGSVAVKEEHIQHASWDAVVDNYVYIHKAFRNHLTYIRMQCEQGRDISQAFKEWKEILDLHSRVEDELFIPALQALLKANDSDKQIPEDILTAKDHDDVKELADDIRGSESDSIWRRHWTRIS